MKNLRPYVLALLGLTLLRPIQAADSWTLAMMGVPGLMEGDDCPEPFNGIVRDSSMDCEYEYTGDPTYVPGDPVRGTTETFFPPRGTPSHVIPRTDLTCEVTCTRTGGLVRAVCLRDPSWTPIQGCPDASTLKQIARDVFSPVGLVLNTEQECRDRIGDLDQFCKDKVGPAMGSTAGTNGSPEVPTKCCDETGGGSPTSIDSDVVVDPSPTLKIPTK